MKTRRKINSKRPSLWVNTSIGSVRIFYPSGRVDYAGTHWFKSAYSDKDPRSAIYRLKVSHTFVSYL